MKYDVFAACLLFALSAPSCQMSDVLLTRVASTEFRFPNEEDCKKKAAADNTGGNITELPEAVSTTPLTYSFSKGMDVNKEELLYKVSPIRPDTITYYEVGASAGMSDGEYKQLLKTAVEGLLKLSTDIVKVQDPKRDNYETNKKFPWRALLTAKKPLLLNVGSQKGQKRPVQVNGNFGLIINPPYPP